METHLLYTLTFGDPLISDFDPRVAQALQHVSRVQSHQICNFVHICNSEILSFIRDKDFIKCTDFSAVSILEAVATFSAISLCLLFSLLLFELHVSMMHDGTSQFVDAVLLLLGEAQDIKSFL